MGNKDIYGVGHFQSKSRKYLFGFLRFAGVNPHSYKCGFFFHRHKYAQKCSLLSRQLSAYFLNLKIFDFQRAYCVFFVHRSCLGIALYPEILRTHFSVLWEYVIQKQVFLDFWRSRLNFRKISFLRLPTSLCQYPFESLFPVSVWTRRNKNRKLVLQKVHKPLPIRFLLNLLREWKYSRRTPFRRVADKRIVQINQVFHSGA